MDNKMLQFLKERGLYDDVVSGKMSLDDALSSYSPNATSARGMIDRGSRMKELLEPNLKQDQYMDMGRRMLPMKTNDLAGEAKEQGYQYFQDLSDTTSQVDEDAERASKFKNLDALLSRGKK